MTALKHIKRTTHVQIAPGYVVINLSGASGGVRYTRETVQTRARKAAKLTTFMNVMHVDHEGFVKQIDGLVKKVDDTVLRHLCVKTSFGHFVSETGVVQLRREVAELRTKIDAVNKAAEVAGSGHRGRIGVVVAALDVEQPEVIAECTRTVGEALTAIHRVLRVGDVEDVITGGVVSHRNQLKPMLLRAKNIETLVIGASRVAVDAALARVQTARPELRAAIARGVDPVTAGDKLDLTVIEDAIARFTFE